MPPAPQAPAPEVADVSERAARPPLGRRARLRNVALLAVALPVLAVGVAGVQAYRSARSGAALMESGTEAAKRGEAKVAHAKFLAARRSFDAGGASLRGWWLRPVGRLPVLGRQVSGARELLGAGSRLAAAGARLTGANGLDDLRLANGGLDTAAVARLEGPLGDTLAELHDVHGALSSARRPLLLPPLDHRLATLTRRVRSAIGQTETALIGSRVIPGLLGADTPRRYFLAIQTPAELRASGGIMGNFGQITSTGGRLRLDRIGRSRDLNLGGTPAARQLLASPDYAARYARFTPQHVWQNVTMSPDFPTVAGVVTNLYPQSGGEPVDGVMSLDPEALAALLKLTGPVRVEGWPEPLTWQNAAHILLKEQYTRLGSGDRVGFLASTAQAVFDRLGTTSIAGPGALAHALGPVIRGRHLMLFSNDAEEQAFFARIGASGALPPVRGDFMAAIIQDGSGSKLDAFLHRSLRYEATFDPRTGRVESHARLRLENRAPASGLPPIVIGGAGPALLGPGENRLYLSLYSPLGFTGATVDDEPLLMESERELGRNVYSAFLTVPPGKAVTVVVQLEGSLPAGSGSGYRLDVTRQPMVIPDELATQVRAVGGTVNGARGLRVDGQVGSATLPPATHPGAIADADTTFELHVEQ